MCLTGEARWGSVLPRLVTVAGAHYSPAVGAVKRNLAACLIIDVKGFRHRSGDRIAARLIEIEPTLDAVQAALRS